MAGPTYRTFFRDIFDYLRDHFYRSHNKPMEVSVINWVKFEAAARSMIGMPYKFGAKWPLGDPSPNGPIDCSGFTRWAYSRVGLYIPEGSQAQFLASRRPAIPSLGDLGFFKNDQNEIHHVGILLNQTDVIEARGEPYNRVIIRPRSKWESWKEFTGWQRPDEVYKKELA